MGRTVWYAERLMTAIRVLMTAITVMITAIRVQITAIMGTDCCNKGRWGGRFGTPKD